MGVVRNLTGASSARAARRGAVLQSESASNAIREQRAARLAQEKLLAPYVAAGTQTLPELQDLAGQELQGLPSVLPGDIGQDSLFQALKQQAISGIESSAAARGKLLSGTTPQAIADRVQQLALARAGDIQQQNVMARQQLMGEQQQRFGQLFNVAGLGQASAAGQAANTQAATSNIGNLMTQQANALAAGQIGSAQARQQGMTNLLGAGALLYGSGALGAAGSALGSLGVGMFGFSDKRLKEDIKKVGKTDEGLPVYTFRYKGEPKLHMGVMAQDVEKVKPEAVKEVDGFKMVNYGAL